MSEAVTSAGQLVLAAVLTLSVVPHVDTTVAIPSRRKR